MITVQELLSRIRWDKDFGRGRIEIGYLDHIEGRIIRVSLRELRFEPGNSFSFEVQTSEGKLVTIPFHRVREVLAEGVPIWRREKGPCPLG